MTISAATEPLPLRVLRETRPLAELLADDEAIESMIGDLRAGDAFVVPRALDVGHAERIRDWLSHVGRNSLPAWHPIAEGSPNFHRVNDWDDRSYVGGCFHQFSFFPWNQDPLRLFSLLTDVYALKNRLHGLEAGSFLGRRPEEGCVARLSVQCYPRGGGALNQHSDPIGYHQTTVPSILLSRPGRDYRTGGLYVVDRAGDRIDVDGLTEVGSALFFNARTPHGVAPIDPDLPLDWLSFSGRWALVAAVNRVAENSEIADSRDLGET